MRERYADQFLENQKGPTRDGIRRQTKENIIIGQSMIFAGKKMCHITLMAGFCRRKRNFNRAEPPVSQALAIVQEGAFLRLGRIAFEIPAGLTTREAAQQAKRELIDTFIQLMMELKKRNYLRRCQRYKSRITPRKLVRKALPGWKRAAYHRVRVIIPSSARERAQRDAALAESGKLWSSHEDWKRFRRGMKKMHRQVYNRCIT